MLVTDTLPQSALSMLTPSGDQHALHAATEVLHRLQQYSALDSRCRWSYAKGNAGSGVPTTIPCGFECCFSAPWQSDLTVLSGAGMDTEVLPAGCTGYCATAQPAPSFPNQLLLRGFSHRGAPGKGQSHSGQAPHPDGSSPSLSAVSSRV